MRFVVRLLFLATLAAVALVPAATAADRMWVGFQDDPVLRWDEGRTEAMDRAARQRSGRAAHDHRLVAGRADAADPADGLLRPRLQVRRRGRVRPQRAAARARGADHALGHAGVGERRPEAPGAARNLDGLPELRAGRRLALLGPQPRVPVRPLLHDLERVEPRHLPRPAVQRRGEDRQPGELREARARGHRGHQGGEQSRQGRDRRDVVERP